MKGAGQIEACVSEDAVTHGPIKQDTALTASNISPDTGTEHRSCLEFSLHNLQVYLFHGGFGFREWVYN